MRRGQHSVSVVAVAAILATFAAGPGFGAGFGLFENGAKAMGTAGAFTARADDPSAMFHNVAGLAFQNERDFMAGITLFTSDDGQATGLGPFPPAGYVAELETLSEITPHFYWVEPVSDTMTFGLAVNSPFGLKTSWKDPDTFLGRFINKEAALTVIDLNPNFAFQASDNFGIGLGLIYRMAEVELHNNQVAPAPFPPVEFAAVDLTSDMERGIGWQVGLLHKYNNSFSWGLSYRSAVEIDFEGGTVFTQVPTGNPFLDGLISANIPFFGQELASNTSIEFPAMASLGAAIALGPTSLMEVDVNWTGWSSFSSLDVAVGDPRLGLAFRRAENWDDVYNYRIGFVFGVDTGSEWRFGYVFDETPQPSAATSPLLPDSDRSGYTIGWGREGGGFDFDIAVMYIDFAGQTSSDSQDGFFASYTQTGWLLGMSVGW